MTITTRPLNPEAFAPFGQVLMDAGTAPVRHEFAARIDTFRPDARLNATFMRVAPAEEPLRITALERHVYSHQTFVPVNGTRHLIAVCPSDANGDPVLSELVVFTAEGSQAVNYNADVWHAPRTALTAPGEFVMLRWDDGSPDDVEVRELETPIEVGIEA